MSFDFYYHAANLRNQTHCSLQHPCDENEGTCNDIGHHTDCKIGLLCGKNNCYHNDEGLRTKSNCCFKPQGKNPKLSYIHIKVIRFM